MNTRSIRQIAHRARRAHVTMIGYGRQVNLLLKVADRLAEG